MHHRSILFTVVLLMFATTVAWGETVDHAWSMSFGSDIHDGPQAIATDNFGNMYVTGWFQNTIDLNGFILTSAGGTDIFLAKIAPAGYVLWAKRFGDGLSDYAYAIDCDDLGYPVITGSFWGNLDLGGGALVSAGNADIFVAKFSPSGSHLWSASWGDASEDVGTAVTFGEAANVYFTGYFYGNLNLGGGLRTGAGAKDIFLAKLDPTGGYLWDHHFGGTLNDDGTDVAIDNSGDVILAANGQSPMDFGGGTLTPIGSDIFLAKFDLNGVYQWAYNYGGSGTAIDGKVEIDASNNIVLTGHVYSGTDMGGGVLTIGGITDMIVAKYSSAGAYMWCNNHGGPDFDFAFDVALDNSDDIVVTGYFKQSADFGANYHVANGEGDIYVASYTTDGTPQWSKSYGGTAQDDGLGLATDTFGNIILFGGFRSAAISVGTNVLVSNGGEDALLIKYYHGQKIHTVRDVPGDQGGLVNVTWYGNGGDNITDRAITEYTVWRAIDAGAAMVMVEEGAALIDDAAKIKSITAGQDIVRAAGEYFWYKVETVDAIGLVGYSAPVATLFDSTGTTAEYHYFQVIAHTWDPFLYYTSEPDSGYSVDNLAPGAPQGLAAEQVAADDLELTWKANLEADLSHYEVYRGTDPGFVADGGSFLTSTPDTTALDTGWSWSGGYWYKVFAVDTHGNKSPYASLSPGLVTTADAAAPAVNRLRQNVPNPFNPITTIEFTLVEAGDATLRIYNATGQLVRTLVDGHREAKTHTVTWNGRDDRGQMVASGVYFYQLSTGEFARTKKMMLLK